MATMATFTPPLPATFCTMFLADYMKLADASHVSTLQLSQTCQVARWGLPNLWLCKYILSLGLILDFQLWHAITKDVSYGWWLFVAFALSRLSWQIMHHTLIWGFKLLLSFYKFEGDFGVHNNIKEEIIKIQILWIMSSGHKNLMQVIFTQTVCQIIPNYIITLQGSLELKKSKSNTNYPFNASGMHNLQEVSPLRCPSH